MLKFILRTKDSRVSTQTSQVTTSSSQPETAAKCQPVVFEKATSALGCTSGPSLQSFRQSSDGASSARGTVGREKSRFKHQGLLDGFVPDYGVLPTLAAEESAGDPE
jgi:hypothetical protein